MSPPQNHPLEPPPSRTSTPPVDQHCHRVPEPLAGLDHATPPEGELRRVGAFTCPGRLPGTVRKGSRGKDVLGQHRQLHVAVLALG